MDIVTLVANVLAIPWLVAGLCLLLILLAWIGGGLLGRGVDAALRRIPIIRLVFRRIDDRDEVVLRLRLRQGIRLLVLAAAIVLAWSVLNTNPSTAHSVARTRELLGNLARQPTLATLLNLLLVLAATWLLSRCLRWVRKGFERLRQRIEAERGARLAGFRFQQLQILSSDQETGLLRTAAQYAQYAVDILLVLAYLASVFSVFPQTRGFVVSVLLSLWQVLADTWGSFVGYLPSLANLVVIAALTYYSLRLIRFFFDEIGKGTISFPGFHPDWATPTFQLVRFAAVALAVVIAFPFLPGSSSPAFQGVSIFIGALLSLGSTSVVANIVAGVVLTYTRAFRVGDRVKIADTVGDVTEKALLVTRVRTIKNVEVTVPNSLVLQSHIVNYSSMAQAQGLILNTTINIGYDVPWRKVHEALVQAAGQTEGIQSDPRPFVFQTSLDDSYVRYELNAYTDRPNEMHVIYSKLHQSVQDACNESGIEILSPSYGAIRDGNRSTIPAEHLPKDYQPPGFRVRAEEKPT